jgi:Beta-lactamase class A
MGDFVNTQRRINRFKITMLMLLLLFSFMGSGKAAIQLPVNAEATPQYNAAFSKLENDYDAELGVYALDTETNKEIAFRADDRFAYCSTFKALAVGVLLKQNSLEQLKQVVKYNKEDILSYAPITKDNIDKGMMLGDLCNAALRFSDNTAANLLFNHIGGPEGLTSALRQMGDTVTQPANIEPTLNEMQPGDIRDTSTPRQLAADLQAYTTGNTLTDDKKKILIHWMTDNAISNTLIRAGAPATWIVADKSGSGPYGRRNDIAMVMRPDKKPIFIAVLSMHHLKEAKYDDKLIAQASKIVFDYFTANENDN